TLAPLPTSLSPYPTLFRSRCAGYRRHIPLAGLSTSTVSSVPPPKCWCASNGDWLRHGFWPARSAAPATTPTTLRWRPRWHDPARSEEHTSELQSRFDLVCR